MSSYLTGVAIGVGLVLVNAAFDLTTLQYVSVCMVVLGLMAYIGTVRR